MHVRMHAKVERIYMHSCMCINSRIFFRMAASTEAEKLAHCFFEKLLLHMNMLEITSRESATSKQCNAIVKHAKINMASPPLFRSNILPN